MSAVGRLALAALVVLGVAAILVQDHGDALPLGLFNQGRATYALLSHACLAAGVAALGVWALELAGRPVGGLGGALRGLLASFLLVELGVGVIDRTLASRTPDAPLGGPYWEQHSGPSGWVLLKKAHPGSPYGFRTATPYPLETGARRVLFLGDSYTEGSGSAPACNYPEVAAATAAAVLGEPLAAMNAGVAGYGPADAAALLGVLYERGYRFDAIVYGLFLENDFTDNLPGTVRRAVAGVNFRFPESAFLRTFHPLNTRTFRYGLFVARASSLAGGAREAAARADGECRDGHEAVAEPLPADLLALARTRLEANYRVGAARTFEPGVAASLAALRAAADELGLPFTVVVFPDRILVDAALRSALGADDPERYDLERLRRWVAEHAPAPVIDVRPALADARDYRPDDTHLSDRGNRRAGAYVGERLAAILASAPAPRP